MQGQKEESVKCFERAIKCDPKDASTYYYLGNVLKSLGRKEEAVKVFLKVVEVKPNSSIAKKTLTIIKELI